MSIFIVCIWLQIKHTIYIGKSCGTKVAIRLSFMPIHRILTGTINIQKRLEEGGGQCFAYRTICRE